MKSELAVEEHGGGSRFQVRLQPRASRTEICGRYGQALKIRISAPPVDNRANHRLLEFLADLLDLAPAQLSLLSGHRSRTKTIVVRGLAPAAVKAKLEACTAQRDRPPSGPR